MADIVYPGETPGGTLGTDFLPSNYDLVLYRGDYFPLRVTLTDSAGVPLDLTGYTAAAQIRSNFDDPVSYDFDVTMTPLTGTIDLLLSSATSETILAGSYVWDFQVTEPSGNIRTYITGDVTMFDEVTR
jgi:hypothetical protein